MQVIIYDIILFQEGSDIYDIPADFDEDLQHKKVKRPLRQIPPTEIPVPPQQMHQPHQFPPQMPYPQMPYPQMPYQQMPYQQMPYQQMPCQQMYSQMGPYQFPQFTPQQMPFPQFTPQQMHSGPWRWEGGMVPQHSGTGSPLNGPASHQNSPLPTPPPPTPSITDQPSIPDQPGTSKIRPREKQINEAGKKLDKG